MLLGGRLVYFRHSLTHSVINHLLNTNESDIIGGFEDRVLSQLQSLSPPFDSRVWESKKDHCVKNTVFRYHVRGDWGGGTVEEKGKDESVLSWRLPTLQAQCLRRKPNATLKDPINPNPYKHEEVMLKCSLPFLPVLAFSLFPSHSVSYRRDQGLQVLKY